MKKEASKTYAKALIEVLLRKDINEKEIVKNFLKILVNTGMISKSDEILSEIDNMLLLKQGKRKIVFETARKITQEQRKNLKSFVKNGDIVKEKINPELIAGIKIIINNSKQFDASMQSKLQEIF